MSKLNKLQHFTNQISSLINKIEDLNKVNDHLITDGEKCVEVKVEDVEFNKLLSPKMKSGLDDKIYSISQMQVDDYESKLEELLGKIEFKN